MIQSISTGLAVFFALISSVHVKRGELEYAGFDAILAAIFAGFAR